MKSSSRLFPARLIRAEVLGQCSEDTYLIKPNNSPDKQVEVAVTHLVTHRVEAGSPGQSEKPPLILVHGNYQNRYFWYSPNGEGLAIELLEKFDVWLMEFRGHGLSPVNQRFSSNTLLDYARYDMPAVNAFVAEKTKAAPIWLGYQEGAASVLFALATRGLQPQSTRAAIGAGNPWDDPWWLKVPGTAWLQKMWLRDQHRDAARGPEPESASLVLAHRAEQTLLGSPGRSLGGGFWQDLASSKVPLRWLASAEDRAALNKKIVQRIGEDLHIIADPNDAKAVSQLIESQLDGLKPVDSVAEGNDRDLLPVRETTSTA